MAKTTTALFSPLHVLGLESEFLLMLRSAHWRTMALPLALAALLTVAPTASSAEPIPRNAKAVSTSSQAATADPMQHYADSVVFDNSTSAKAFFNSRVTAVAPSMVEKVDTKLPLEHEHVISGPNSIRLHWQSKPRGAWTAQIRTESWPNRTAAFQGNSLSFWVYTPQSIAPTAFPKLALEDSQGGFTESLSLRDMLHTLSAGQWTRVLVPLSRFRSASVHTFTATKLNALLFTQDAEDSSEHTLLLDEVRILTPSAADQRTPATPLHVRSKGYERHVDVSWDDVTSAGVTDYVIYRASAEGTWKAVGTQRPGVGRYTDFTDVPGQQWRYRVTARTAALKESQPSQLVTAETHSMSDDALLDMVEEASFRYYWNGAEPHSGMSRESIPGDSDLIAVGATGFGLMNMIVAADRGFVPREDVVVRMLKVTAFLDHADRFHGVWPHYLSGRSGHVLPVFGIYDDGGDLVETSFLLQGLLAARGYFTNDTPQERELRSRITKLWEGVEWNWYVTPDGKALWWHWSPHYGYSIANRLQGFNESMITYVLAIASPTHGVPASLYETGWAAQGDASHPFPIANTYYGIHVDVNYLRNSPGPLFFTHYNFFGFDPHYQDKWTNWFANNRNISHVQQEYAIHNPGKFAGYRADAWGLSAVTGPNGYREFKPFDEDDGTLAPTAALGAYAYTPQPSLQALKHFYRDLGAQTWTVYGFRNAFNLQHDWYSPDELGLNQAPQAIMIENGRTGLLWHAFMPNVEIQRMLHAAGLRPDIQGASHP